MAGDEGLDVGLGVADDTGRGRDHRRPDGERHGHAAPDQEQPSPPPASDEVIEEAGRWLDRLTPEPDQFVERTDHVGLIDVDRVELVVVPLLERPVGHRSPASAVRRRERPRWIRDRTVPTGHVERLGDLVVAVAEDVTEHHRRPVVLRQGSQRVLDVLGQTGGVEVLGRRRTRRQHPVRVLLGQGVGGATLALADLVEEGVGGDARQPRLHVPRAIGRQASLHPQQHVLHQILRVVVISGEPIGHRVQEAPVLVGHLFPRRDPLGGRGGVSGGARHG